MTPTTVLKALILVAGLATVTAAHADKRDLQMFNNLAQTGLMGEEEMSKFYLGASDIVCKYASADGTYFCEMNDTSMEANGKKVYVQGRVAKHLMRDLETFGVQGEGAMGSYLMSASNVTCHQVHEGVGDGTRADNTSCDVTIDQN